MVTCSGRSRRSLRRPIANATARTPKATPPCTALGDHQTLPSTKLHAAGLLRPETLARYITKQSFGLERQMHVPLTLGRGFGLGSLGPHAFGWWNTGPCFGHAGGFGVVAFADPRSRAAVAILTNGHRGVAAMIRRFAPLGSAVKAVVSRI